MFDFSDFWCVPVQVPIYICVILHNSIMCRAIRIYTLMSYNTYISLQYWPYLSQLTGNLVYQELKWRVIVWWQHHQTIYYIKRKLNAEEVVDLVVSLIETFELTDVLHDSICIFINNNCGWQISRYSYWRPDTLKV